MNELMMLGSMGMLMLGKALTLKKMGDDGWRGLIPVYGDWRILKAAGASGIYCASLFFSVLGMLWLICEGFNVFGIAFTLVGMAMAFSCYQELAASFRKSTGFAVGLMLVPMVFYPILAFGSALYDPSVRARNEGESKPIEGEGAVQEAA